MRERLHGVMLMNRDNLTFTFYKVHKCSYKTQRMNVKPVYALSVTVMPVSILTVISYPQCYVHEHWWTVH